MPNVGLTTSTEPLSPDAQVSIRYTVEVEGLPVYTELYDVDKLAKELATDPDNTARLWHRRLEAPLRARTLPCFSAELTGHLAAANTITSP